MIAMIQRRVDPAISRRVRRGRDAVDVFKRVVLVSGAVLGDAQIVHSGAFGQSALVAARARRSQALRGS